jgi:hypothetical protein
MSRYFFSDVYFSISPNSLEDAVDFLGVGFIHLPQGVRQNLDNVLRPLLRNAQGIIHRKSARIAQLPEGLNFRTDLEPFKISGRQYPQGSAFLSHSFASFAVNPLKGNVTLDQRTERGPFL